MTTTTTIASLLDTLPDSPAAEQLLDAAEAALLERQEFHRLFDVKLIRARRQLNMPLTQPSSLENIPAEKQPKFREAFVSAAREIGHLLLDNDQLADAWAYLRTIGEPEPVRAAIDKIPIPREPDEAFNEIVNLALYDGAHVVWGINCLLNTHGTCNTVTAFSQLQQQMTQEERRHAAAIMVRRIYEDLQHSIRRDLESRNPVVPADATIRELIRGQDALFAEGNYHTDVSHLHSIVGFARSLTPDDAELPLAIELCEYGSKLTEPLRYPGNIPFEDYYTGHLHFLNALAGHNVDEAMTWFHDRMEEAEDDSRRQLAAFVILDLGQRTGREEESLQQVASQLSRLEDPNGFSFSTLCVELGHLELLEKTAIDNDDIVAWTIARLSESP